jgi:hypothetical protein
VGWREGERKECGWEIRDWGVAGGGELWIKEKSAKPLNRGFEEQEGVGVEVEKEGKTTKFVVFKEQAKNIPKTVPV